jgi:hypothetical protein
VRTGKNAETKGKNLRLLVGSKIHTLILSTLVLTFDLYRTRLLAVGLTAGGAPINAHGGEGMDGRESAHTVLVAPEDLVPKFGSIELSGDGAAWHLPPDVGETDV